METGEKETFLFEQEIQQVQAKIETFVNQVYKAQIDDRLTERLQAISRDLSQAPEHIINLNIYQTLNPTLFITTARNSFRKHKSFWWLDTLDVLRNLLILAPVMLTWLGLSEASQSYARALAGDPELKFRPFLELWQTGFASQLHPLLGVLPARFSDIAFLDFSLILVIIMVSGIVHTQRDSRIERHEQAVLSLADELNDILWGVERVLMYQRHHHYENSEQRAIALLNSIDEYVAETRQKAVDILQGLTEEEERITTRAAENQEQYRLRQSAFQDDLVRQQKEIILLAGAHLNAVLDLNQKAMDEIATKQRELLDAANGRLDTIQQHSSETLDLIAAEQQRLAHQSEQQIQVVKDLREFTLSFREGVKEFGQITPVVNRALEGLRKNVAEVADNTGEIKSGQLRLLDALQSLEGSLGAFEQVTGQLVRDMRESSHGLAQSAEQVGVRLEQTNQVWSGVLEQVGALEVQLERGQSGLANILNEQRTLTGQIQGQWSEAAQRQHEEIAHFAAEVARLEPMLNGFKIGIANAIQSAYSQAEAGHKERQDWLQAADHLTARLITVTAVVQSAAATLTQLEQAAADVQSAANAAALIAQAVREAQRELVEVEQRIAQVVSEEVIETPLHLAESGMGHNGSGVSQINERGNGRSE